METIEIKNVGAIERLTIPVPPDGGVVVLTGKNGTGKSTALDAVSSLVSGKGKIPIRDGANNGGVDGFGARITLGSATRRHGQAEAVVDHIESRFSISDLVDPGIDSPAAADKRRIKALLTLVGKETKAETFEQLFSSPEEFKTIVSVKSVESSDPVEMAERVKRDVESHARIKEEQHKQRMAEYDAALAASDFNPDDLINLNEALDAISNANSEAGKLKEQYNKSLERIHQIEAAKQFLEDFDVSGKEQRRESLENEIRTAEDETKDLNSEVNDLTEQIRLLQDKLAVTKSRHAASVQSLRSLRSSRDSIQSELATLEQHRRILAEDIELGSITEETVANAEKRSSELRRIYNRGLLADAAKKRRDSSKQILESADKLKATADRYRRIAADCDTVLTELLGEDNVIRVRNGRLVTSTSRGETPYAELSDGERWKVAFQVLSGRIRKSKEKLPVITIPQIGWESLDPDNQQLVRDLARKHRIVVFTAEATLGGINVSN
ncbi:MAG: AAA family ATPase [Planctomycetaceae bacterium]|nr:AAA family ATPase [Planctomycetaceae bacterium]